jgi:hypothetical protein
MVVRYPLLLIITYTSAKNTKYSTGVDPDAVWQCHLGPQPLLRGEGDARHHDKSDNDVDANVRANIGARDPHLTPLTLLVLLVLLLIIRLPLSLPLPLRLSHLRRVCKKLPAIDESVQEEEIQSMEQDSSRDTLFREDRTSDELQRQRPDAGNLHRLG